ncbi:MAG: translocation/assembly module TamB, partial [Cytophagaceae bacterium]|nr:translocation/assembly module TamB [Cytophagaceae bacterium]
SYFDKRKEIITEGFDHNHFSFEKINAQVTNLRIILDTFQIQVNKLSAFEPNIKLPVYELNTLFTITKRDMTFEKLYAQIGQSTVKDYIRFNYNNINDLSDFNNKVEVVAYLNECQLDFENLKEFAPGLKPYRDFVRLSGFFKGEVSDFTVKDMDLYFGNGSHISGRISFNGLPDFEETFLEFKFKNLKVEAADLKQYLDQQSNFVLAKFGYISGNGDFIGFPQDFVAHGAFNSGLGKFTSDIQLNATKEDERAKYKGTLKTYAFDLGRLMDIPDKVQLLDMDGEIEGVGFSMENAEIKNLNATISRIGLNNYDYKNIKTNARLSKREFNGEIAVRDSNLIFEADGKIDFTKNQEIFDIKAHVEKANLKPLNLTEVETLVKTDLDLNFTGTKIDEIVGEAVFKNTYLLYRNDKEIFLDSLYARSTKNGEERILRIHSDLATLNASGNFHFTTVAEDIERLYKEYKLNIVNDKAALTAYYQNKPAHKHAKYSLDFDVNIKDLNSLFEIYAPGLYLSRDVNIAGNFICASNSVLNINTQIDTLYYKGNELFNTNIDLSTSKLEDSTNVLAMVYLSSGKQRINGAPETNNFYFEGIWDRRMIDFSTSLGQTNSTNKIDLRGNLSFQDNRKYLSLRNSTINLLNKDWKISQNNLISFARKEIIFENVSISNEKQLISINGTISDDASKLAELNVENFDLHSIKSFITESDLGGIVSGKLLIKDLYNDLHMNGNINVNDFSIDGFPIGNIIGTSNWDGEKRQLNIDMDVLRENFVTISLDGYIKPQTGAEREELNFIASLQNADLEILSPLIKEIMSDVSGKVTGDFTVKGTFKDIKLSGKGDVKKGQFKIDYLGTTYFFNDDIYLTENEIGFRKMKLKDEYGNTAIVDGGIFHDGFKKFIVDLRGNLYRTNVLNITEKDNKLFYGTAFVTGDFEVLGPFSNLKISSNTTSNKGTKIYIPLNTNSGLEQEDYIVFKPKNAPDTDKDKKDKVDLSGVELDFNLELTQDAYAEIIFDKRMGDIIRGYGNGNIRMQIDTRGDFNMYGNYRIAKGAYNYTLAGLISKEFTIQPNSSINWTGDPYGGTMDVKAYFENKVPITPLIPVSDSASIQREAGRTHPVKVFLDLDGPLLSPDIALDIDITPTTGVATEVATRFESEIKRNEQELNKQVFSLLVLGAFQPENSFSGIAGATGNVSQLLTNQLGNWLSQVDENLQIDIDLNGLDKEALNTFNLRLSYTFLEGRVRVSRDGSFTNMQNNTQQNLGNIAGEWTVEYLLSKDGKFRLKLYNKNNQNPLLNTINTGNYTTAGFSVLHTQSFNNLSDLLGIGKKSKKQ